MRPPAWLPKSQVQVRRGEWFDVLLIPAWLARKHKIAAKPTPKVDMLKGEMDNAQGMSNL